MMTMALATSVFILSLVPVAAPATQQAAVAAADGTIEITGTITSRTLYSISSSAQIVDGKAGPGKVTIAAAFEVQAGDGKTKEFSWSNDPATRVVDKAGKPGVFGDVAKGDKVVITLRGSDKRWLATEIRLTDKDAAPRK